MGKPPMSMSAVITADEVRTTVSDALRRSYQWTRNARDNLALSYGWGVRKARSIYDGEQPPTAADLLNLMASNDVIYDEVMRLTGRDRPLTEETRRELLALLRGQG